MIFRSKLEARLGTGPFAELRYEPVTVKYPKEEGRYTPDFVSPGGAWIEVKGFFAAKDRTKMLAVQKAHPGKWIRFVFQTPYQTLSKTSDTTYAKWAEKHGFEWCAANDRETLERWAKE